MDNENNQLPDINVGNLNFQPMQKRFMVWDTKYEKFLTVPMEIWQIVVHFRNRYHQLYDDSGNSRYIIVQSTNLFDKDGEEIFEGCIVMYNHNTYFVRQDRYNGMWLLKNVKTGDCSESINGWENGKDERLKLLGHILSNPELLEENK